MLVFKHICRRLYFCVRQCAIESFGEAILCGLYVLVMLWGVLMRRGTTSTSFDRNGLTLPLKWKLSAPWRKGNQRKKQLVIQFSVASGSPRVSMKRNDDV